ncbi:MAG: elongation factor P [Candidatus Moranbacteria bacterium]|nr:elongation factor P [Candidatus Moranbacteria bacterium]
MIEIKKIKVRDIVEYKNKPREVVKASFSKIGRQGAVLRTKLKDLTTGTVNSYTFRDSDKLEKIQLEKEKAQYLYEQGEDFYFMNLRDYEQFFLKKETLGNLTDFLIPDCKVDILYHKSQPINISLPIKMNFEVTESPPAEKGNTVDGGSKKVKIQTGLMVDAPLFIKTGDIIRIKTTDGSYVERMG